MREEDLKKYKLTRDEWSAIENGDFTVIANKPDQTLYYALALAFGIDEVLNHLTSPQIFEKALIITAEYGFTGNAQYILNHYLKHLSSHYLGIALCLAAHNHNPVLVRSILEKAITQISQEDLATALVHCAYHNKKLLHVFIFTDEKLLFQIFDRAITQTPDLEIKEQLFDFLQSQYLGRVLKREAPSFYPKKLNAAMTFQCPQIVTLILTKFGHYISKKTATDLLLDALFHLNFACLLALMKGAVEKFGELSSPFLLRLLETAALHGEDALVTFLLNTYAQHFNQRNIQYCIYLAASHHCASCLRELCHFYLRQFETPTSPIEEFDNALEAAAAKGYRKVVKVLLMDCRALISDMAIVIAFMEAAEKNEDLIIETFLNCTSHTIITYIEVCVILQRAKDSRNVHSSCVLEAELTKRLSTDKNIESFLFLAAKNNFVISLPILRNIQNITLSSRALSDALLIACQGGHVAFARELYTLYKSQLNQDATTLALSLAEPSIQPELEKLFSESSLYFSYTPEVRLSDTKLSLKLENLSLASRRFRSSS